MKNSPSLFHLLNELNRLYECRSVDELPKTTQQVLANTVACDVVGWFDVTEQTTVRAYDHWLDTLAKESEDFARQVDEIFQLHPFTVYFLSGGSERVLRLSDFEGSSEWHRHPLFKPISRSYRARFLLGTRIVRPGDGYIALSIGRNSADFSDEEITRVEEILQHIERHALSLGLLAPGQKKIEPPDLSLCGNKLKEKYSLTAREAEIAYWTAQGKTNGDLAIILNISPHTVRTHLQKIFVKMSVETRAALAHTVWSLCSQPD